MLVCNPAYDTTTRLPHLTHGTKETKMNLPELARKDNSRKNQVSKSANLNEGFGSQSWSENYAICKLQSEQQQLLEAIKRTNNIYH